MNINDLKPGVIFVYEGQPWKVIKTTHVHMGRGGAVLQTKMRHLLNGNVQEKAFRPRDEVKEADIEKRSLVYLYNHRGEYWFCEKNDKAKRFALEENVVGKGGIFLKANTEVVAILFNNEIVGIEIPIKITLKVTDAPPAVRGDTQGAVTKKVALESGAQIDAPIFIKEEDQIVVNTQTGQYISRA